MEREEEAEERAERRRGRDGQGAGMMSPCLSMYEWQARCTMAFSTEATGKRRVPSPPSTGSKNNRHVLEVVHIYTLGIYLAVLF